ncbi:hypothetical protein H9P43_009587 [Blastocladiella emersonii ATCC 22665]|nr:hypothetical protein H9P43_009587 [Blastocladiella emersonii ATCC 22665]
MMASAATPPPPRSTSNGGAPGPDARPPWQDLDDQVGDRIDPPLASIRRVLVTGGAGFIASFLVRKLARLYPEWQLVVIDKLDYCSSLRSLDGLPSDRVVFEQGDIADPAFVNRVFAAHAPIDTVVHLAAQSHVDNSFGSGVSSLEFTRANVLGTHVLLEAARQCAPTMPRFVHVSTDEVYGDIPGDAPNAREDAPLAPNNPYSATKAAAECLVRAYHRTYGLPAIVTRSNNVYGPCQFPEKIVPKFVCLLLEGRRCTIHGDGSNVRRYLYVSDVADALDVVIHRGVPGEIYNIGTDVEMANVQLAETLVRAVYPDARDPIAEHCEWVPDRALNDRRYAVDSAKMRKLGWTPRVSLDEGLARTSTFAFYSCELDGSLTLWADV